MATAIDPVGNFDADSKIVALTPVVQVESSTATMYPTCTMLFVNTINNSEMDTDASTTPTSGQIYPRTRI